MKLTDKQRKQIIAEYVAGDGNVSHRALATKYNVSPTTIWFDKDHGDNDTCVCRSKKKHT